MQETIDPNNTADQLQFLCWYLYQDPDKHDAWDETEFTLALGEVLASPSPYIQDADRAGISLEAHAFWKSRADVMEEFDLETDTGRLGYLSWWLSKGVHLANQTFRRPKSTSSLNKVVDASDRNPSAIDQALSAPSPYINEAAESGISLAAHASWLATTEVQEVFDLATQEGRFGFFTWWLTSGSGRKREARPQWIGSNPSPYLENAQRKGISLELHAIWKSRKDLQRHYPLETKKGRLDYLAWWVSCASGLEDVEVSPLPDWLASSPSPYLKGSRKRGITLVAHATWACRPDLQWAFSLEDPHQALGFLGWWLEDRRKQSAQDLPDWLIEVLDAPSEYVETASDDGIPVELSALWAALPALQEEFELENVSDRVGLLGWYIYHWKPKQPRALATWLIRSLCNPSPRITATDSVTKPSLLLDAIWHRSDSIRLAYELRNPADREGMTAWAIWLLPSIIATQIANHPQIQSRLREIDPDKLFDHYVRGKSIPSERPDPFEKNKIRTLQIFEILKSSLNDDQKILEVGHHGPFGFIAKNNRASLLVKGIDTKRFLDSGYADASFDLVIFTDVLEDISEDDASDRQAAQTVRSSAVQRVLEEADRVLEAGGHFLISTPNVSSLVSLQNILNHKHPFVMREHLREFTVGELTEQVKGLGYQVILEETCDVWDLSRDSKATPALKNLEGILTKIGLSTNHRGDCTFVLAEKPIEKVTSRKAEPIKPKPLRVEEPTGPHPS